MKQQRSQKRGRTGKLVCRCGKGYASEFDGLCLNCRGMTAWEARQKADPFKARGAA
jgi:hypothetical protein